MSEINCAECGVLLFNEEEAERIVGMMVEAGYDDTSTDGAVCAECSGIKVED